MLILVGRAGVSAAWRTKLHQMRGCPVASIHRVADKASVLGNWLGLGLAKKRR